MHQGSTFGVNYFDLFILEIRDNILWEEEEPGKGLTKAWCIVRGDLSSSSVINPWQDLRKAIPKSAFYGVSEEGEVVECVSSHTELCSSSTVQNLSRDVGKWLPGFHYTAFIVNSCKQ